MPQVKHTYPAESADLKHFLSGLHRRNDHYLHAVVDFNRQIDVDLLKKAVTLTFRSVPLLTCRFVLEDNQAYWQEAGWTSDDIVSVFETDYHERLVQQQLIQKPDELAGPQIHVSVIRQEGRDSITVVLNHMICDGRGICEYLYLLSSCYSLLENNGDPADLHIPEPQRRSFNQVIDHLSEQQLAEVRSAAIEHYPQTERDYLPLEGDAENPFILFHKISAGRFGAIRKHARLFGATVNDALFAAFVCALSEVLPVDRLILDCPLNARVYLPNDYTPGLCNLTANLCCVIPTHLGESYEEALKEVKKVMSLQKDRLDTLKVYSELERVYQEWPLQQAMKEFSKIYKIPINGLTNIGVLDEEKLKFGSLETTGASASGSIKYAPYFQTAVTTYRQEVTFSTNFHGTEKDYRFLDHLLRRMIASFPGND